MTPVSATWLAVGAMLGVGAAVVSETDLPKREDCQVYRVARKSAVSYVLRPPVLEQVKCETFQPTPIAKLPEPESQIITDEKQENIEQTDKPHRHHRHRHWRRWR